MDTTTFSFRTASETDIPAIVSLVTSAYRGDASRTGWTTEADLLDGPRVDVDLLRQDLLRPLSQVLLAESPAGELLACAHVAIDAGAGYFGMFAVRPDQQGSGIGRQVIAEAERIARDDWRQTRMRMTVIDIRDELIAYYERRGYRRTGVKKPFPYGDERFGIPLREDIRFEVLEKLLPQPATAA
jgi:ribosomal protein S18 acetylase RimI-like enzyme